MSYKAHTVRKMERKEEERKIEKQKMNMKVAKTTKRHHKEFVKEAGN